MAPPKGHRQSGDMDAQEFREAAHRVADMVADYLEGLEQFPVRPDLRPGEVRAALPAAAPDGPEAWESILRDYRDLIEPNFLPAVTQRSL